MIIRIFESAEKLRCSACMGRWLIPCLKDHPIMDRERSEPLGLLYYVFFTARPLIIIFTLRFFTTIMNENPIDGGGAGCMERTQDDWRLIYTYRWCYCCHVYIRTHAHVLYIKVHYTYIYIYVCMCVYILYMEYSISIHRTQAIIKALYSNHRASGCLMTKQRI